MLSNHISPEEARKIQTQGYYQSQLLYCLDNIFMFQQVPQFSIIVQLLLKNFQQRNAQIDMVSDTYQVAKQQDQMIKSFKEQLQAIKQKNTKLIGQLLNLRQKLIQVQNSSNNNKKAQVTYQQLLNKIRKGKNEIANKIQKIKMMEKVQYQQKQQMIKLDTPLIQLRNEWKYQGIIEIDDEISIKQYSLMK